MQLRGKRARLTCAAAGSLRIRDSFGCEVADSAHSTGDHLDDAIKVPASCTSAWLVPPMAGWLGVYRCRRSTGLCVARVRAAACTWPAQDYCGSQPFTATHCCMARARFRCTPGCRALHAASSAGPPPTTTSSCSWLSADRGRARLQGQSRVSPDSVMEGTARGCQDPCVSGAVGSHAAMGSLSRAGRDAQLSRLGQQARAQLQARYQGKFDRSLRTLVCVLSCVRCLRGSVCGWGCRRALVWQQPQLLQGHAPRLSLPAGLTERQRLCAQIRELQAQKARLEGLFEDSCAKRQAADERTERLRSQVEAEKVARAKQARLSRPACTPAVQGASPPPAKIGRP